MKGNRLYRADPNGLFDLVPQGLGGPLIPAEHLVVAQLEDLRGHVSAFSVRLAQVEIDGYLHEASGVTDSGMWPGRDGRTSADSTPPGLAPSARNHWGAED